jgi:hypothetical protein
MGTFSVFHWLIILTIVALFTVVPLGAALLVIYMVNKRNKAQWGNLAICPDCGGPVSRLAAACPHCGRPTTPNAQP